MNFTQVRKKIATQIVVFYLILISALVIYYILKGFDTNEFTSTFSLLSSVAAIYFGLILQRITNSMNNKLEIKNDINQKIELPNIIVWLIPIHFLGLFAIISLKAFTLITYQDMNTFLAGIESLFGVYMGNLFSNLFESKIESK